MEVVTVRRSMGETDVQCRALRKHGTSDAGIMRNAREFAGSSEVLTYSMGDSANMTNAGECAGSSRIFNHSTRYPDNRGRTRWVGQNAIQSPNV